MEVVVRKAATSVVFGIPAMVLGGFAWHASHSWGVVFLVEALFIAGVGLFIYRLGE